MANRIRKLSFPLLIALLLTLAVVYVIKFNPEHYTITPGMWVYIGVYMVMIGVFIFKDLNGERHVF